MKFYYFECRMDEYYDRVCGYVIETPFGFLPILYSGPRACEFKKLSDVKYWLRAYYGAKNLAIVELE